MMPELNASSSGSSRPWNRPPQSLPPLMSRDSSRRLLLTSSLDHLPVPTSTLPATPLGGGFGWGWVWKDHSRAQPLHAPVGQLREVQPRQLPLDLGRGSHAHAPQLDEASR